MKNATQRKQILVYSLLLLKKSMIEIGLKIYLIKWNLVGGIM